jgi:MoaA/NifB/PqqE/SkfB family radical SAM enzyme
MSTREIAKDFISLASLGIRDTINPLQHQLFGVTPPFGAKPVNVTVEVVDRCTLRCTMCDIWQHTGDGELTIEELTRVFDELKSWLGSFHLTITGGEPTMKGHIWDYLEHVTASGIPVILLTNGYSLNDKMIERLTNLRLSQISISIDGHAELHNQVRGLPNAFERTWNAIQKMLPMERTFTIATNTVILEQNITQLGEITQFLWEGGVERILFQPIQGGAFQAPVKEGEDREKRKASTEVIESNFPYDSDLWPSSKDRVNQGIDALLEVKAKGAPVGNSEQEIEYFREYLLNGQEWNRPWSCPTTHDTLFVDAYGNARMCIPFTAAVGNVRERSLPEIWTSEYAEKTRDSMMECTEPCLYNCTRKNSLIQKGQYAVRYLAKRV